MTTLSHPVPRSHQRRPTALFDTDISLAWATVPSRQILLFFSLASFALAPVTEAEVCSFYILSIFPIIDVESWTSFAVKISSVVIGLNLVGGMLFYGARRRRGVVVA